MTYYVIKVLVSALLIVLISEVAKRLPLIAGIIASIPLTSVLAMIWLYVDTGDNARIAVLATDIFWLVLPSLVLFLTLPLLLKAGWGFPAALLISCALTALAYGGMLKLLAVTGWNG